MIIDIQPVQIVNKTAMKVLLQPATLDYGNTASAAYLLLDADGAELLRGGVAMTAEQYANWGTNDDYAVDCFLQNIGVTRVI